MFPGCGDAGLTVGWNHLARLPIQNEYDFFPPILDAEEARLSVWYLLEDADPGVIHVRPPYCLYFYHHLLAAV